MNGERPVMPIDGFEWDEEKRHEILRRRGIDFIDAAKVLLGKVYQFQSSRHGESRYVAIGPLEVGTLIAIVYTIRGTKLRIITARRARHSGQNAYNNAVSVAADEGADRLGSPPQDDG